MRFAGSIGPTLEQFTVTAKVEHESAFRDVVLGQTRRGMIMVGVLSLAAAALYVLAHLGAGKTFAWTYGDRDPADVVTLWDKALLVGLSVILLLLSGVSWGVRHGRLLIATAVLAVSVAYVLNDLARSDLSFTSAWLALLLLVPLAAVPYTLWQGLGLSAAVFGLFLVAVVIWPDLIVVGDGPVSRGVFLALVALILPCVAGYLYTSQYRQFRAHQRAEQLTQRLAKRRRELGRSLRELKAAQARLVQSEKLASLGQLTAGIAHEIQNPLNFVNNFASLNEELAQELGGVLAPPLSPEAEAVIRDIDLNARRIREHGARASEVVCRMLEHAPKTVGTRTATDLNRLVGECIEQGRHCWSDAVVAVVLQGDPAVGEVVAHPPELQRAFFNIVDNAVRAVRQRGAAEGEAYVAHVEVVTARRGSIIEVCVRDNGLGIPEAVRQRLFEPFFTTRPSGDGTGLGLSLAYDVVTQGHGGTIEVWTEEGTGSVFTVRLPSGDRPLVLSSPEDEE